MVDATDDNDDIFSGWKWGRLLDAPLLDACEKYAYHLTAGGPAPAPDDDVADSGGEQNWSHNIQYAASQVHRPTSMKELQTLVRNAASCRALGTRHSFSFVADCTGILIQPPVTSHINIDPVSCNVSCSAGVTYAVLASRLQAAGWALHNLASLPHISVAGAIATATHGSGDGLGNLATAVVAVEYVDAAGRAVVVRSGETLQALLLGAIGIVTHVTLAIEPSFDVRQDVYIDVPWACLQRRASLDQLFAEAYSVSVFIDDWGGTRGGAQVWLKRRVPPRTKLPPAPRTLFGARLARQPIHMCPGQDPSACTPQGEVGPWSERLAHFRADRQPSSRGDELQSEYFVSREDAPAAITAMRRIGAALRPVLQVSELRVVAADELWLSPCYGRDSMGIHFTWRHDLSRVLTEALPLVERVLAPFGARCAAARRPLRARPAPQHTRTAAHVHLTRTCVRVHRPHWGKLFVMPPPQLAMLYPRLADYRALIAQLDPDGKFHNDFVRRYIFSGHSLRHPTWRGLSGGIVMEV